MRATILALFTVLMTSSLTAADPNFWKHEWPQTDFTKTSVKSWVEILSGGPPKDGIPAINTPKFHSPENEDRLIGREPVITLALPGQPQRAYPIRYLIWHEIVNDTVGDLPIAVTFCPLCNSGITFDRRTPSGTLTFGVSGKLRNSDMIMFDRETESWWQQAVGQAIVGQLTGTTLTALPSWMESWDQFKSRNAKTGLVMQQPNARRDYGRNPYQGYDTSQKPFLYSGELPPNGISPLARVVRVGSRAWPLSRIRKAGTLAEAGINISWQAGQASALDSAKIAKGRDVGTIRVRDTAGRDLPHDVMFAFAFHAFWPDGEWMDN